MDSESQEQKVPERNRELSFKSFLSISVENLVVFWPVRGLKVMS